MALRRFIRSFTSLLNKLDAASVCFHMDIFYFGTTFPDPVFRKSRETVLKTCEGAIFEAVSGRTVLFPTFNYDYFKTRVYDVARDPCQVGILNEHFRTLPGARRTATPGFNFSIFNASDNTFSFEPREVPFSEQSTFAEMVRAKTWLVFLGASVAASTLIHLCEYRARVGYRYLKHFPGSVLLDGQSIPVRFSFRVGVSHPHTRGAFDWDRMEKEMAAAAVIRYLPETNKKILLYRADQACGYWTGILKKDGLEGRQ